MRVLFVENDGIDSFSIKCVLEQEGFEVTWLRTARRAWEEPGRRHDVVLLGLGELESGSAAFCGHIRTTSGSPIIVASAVPANPRDAILLHQHRADFYLEKPHDVARLLARLRAVQRRLGPPVSTTATSLIELRDIRIDVARAEVVVSGTVVALPHKQFELFAMVASARGRICPRDRVLARLWNGRTGPGENRSLDVHVAALRRRLGRPGVVETVRGRGFRLGQDWVPDEG